MTKRFTLDGSRELEQHLSRVCDATQYRVQAASPRSKLEGLLLAGGYGRGEGGVLRTSGGDRVYNDLDFYVCLRGQPWLNQMLYDSELQALQKELAERAGIEVELKILSLAKLRKSPVTMFSYDIVLGHRWLLGTEDLLSGCDHHRSAEDIPLAEAGRLLMNRCSGLLFARELLDRPSFTPHDADFVGRNLAKAQLAYGDIILTAFGRYHWSCRQRQARLKSLEAQDEMPWLDEVRQHHATGVEFKLHPTKSQASAAELSRLHNHLSDLGLHLWLWLEGRRLAHPFRSAREYAFSRGNKCPDSAPLRNLLINAQRLGPSSVLSPGAIRYPRERLLVALALLLWEPCVVADPAILRRVQRALRTPARRYPDLVLAYRHLWEHFS